MKTWFRHLRWRLIWGRDHDWETEEALKLPWPRNAIACEKIMMRRSGS